MLKNNVKILVEKTQLDQDLNKFAQTTIKLWQYYQIKTYKNKIIFKMKQSDFNKLGDLAEEGKVSL